MAIRENKKFCNVCVKEFDEWDERESFGMYRRQIGYGSIFDGSRLELDLCCDCFDKLLQYIVDQCQICPVEEVMDL